MSFSIGRHTIKLLLADQSVGPRIDHLRVGKPPAVVVKVNGWPRVVARNGLNLANGNWGYDFTNGVNVTFSDYPTVKDWYGMGWAQIQLPDGSKLDWDVGNPSPFNFTGYEQYLQHYFTLGGEVFTETSSDLFTRNQNSYLIAEGEEMHLRDGLDSAAYPECDLISPFAEEGYSAPVFALLPDGAWLQWTPTIILEDNGPSINALQSALADNTLADGGGETFIETNEQVKCSNVPRTFFNEATCSLSTLSTACSAVREIGEVLISMSKANVISFYDLSQRYVYAVRGLVMESLDEHACVAQTSRWQIEAGVTCEAPTQGLGSGTIEAIAGALNTTLDSNEFVRDIGPLTTCNSTDIILDNIGIQIQVGEDCYTQVHSDHLNVYDFTGWTKNHPGGEYHIEKWASGDDWVSEGWYLDFPFAGNETRKIPQHPMNRWYAKATPPNIVYVSRLGDDLPYRDLPSSMKTNAIAEYFGALPETVFDGGIVTCGSPGEETSFP